MKRWIPAVALTAATVGFLVWLAGGGPPSLMAQATRVPGFSTTAVIAPMAWGWPSEHEVIFSDPSPRLPGGYMSVDVVTGRMTHSIWSIPGRLNPVRAVMWLAPNGRYALHFARDEWLLSDSRGSILGRWLHIHDGYVQWAPDSRSVVIRELNGRLMVAALQGGIPRIVQATSNGLPEWYSPTGGVGLQVSRYDGRPSFLVIPSNGSRRGSARRIEWPADASVVYGVQASPRGDRLAWYIGRKNRRSRLIDWLMSALHVRTGPARATAPRQPSIDTEGIWVSDMDGSNMREVGEVKAEWAPAGMGSFTWCPDGRHVLVTYRNGLYLVSTDE